MTSTDDTSYTRLMQIQRWIVENLRALADLARGLAQNQAPAHQGATFDASGYPRAGSQLAAHLAMPEALRGTARLVAADVRGAYDALSRAGFEAGGLTSRVNAALARITGLEHAVAKAKHDAGQDTSLMWDLRIALGGQAGEHLIDAAKRIVARVHALEGQLGKPEAVLEELERLLDDVHVPDSSIVDQVRELLRTVEAALEALGGPRRLDHGARPYETLADVARRVAAELEQVKGQLADALQEVARRDADLDTLHEGGDLRRIRETLGTGITEPTWRAAERVVRDRDNALANYEHAAAERDELRKRLESRGPVFVAQVVGPIEQGQVVADVSDLVESNRQLVSLRAVVRNACRELAKAVKL